MRALWDDGETYTIALYFSEFNQWLQPLFIHRNGGKYYKFNFTYSNNPVPSAIELPKADSSIATTPWFSLDGRRLGQQPAQKGIYVNGGRKVFVK